jgi:hypothetical protein
VVGSHGISSLSAGDPKGLTLRLLCVTAMWEDHDYTERVLPFSGKLESMDKHWDNATGMSV